jgi:ABC-type Fe3+-hydroxamate transport system substrate-binding protein
MKKNSMTFMIFLLSLCVLSLHARTAAAAITFTDIMGREVTFENLPQRIILSDYNTNYMLVGGAENIKKIVGMRIEGWDDTRYGEYVTYTQAFPQMAGGKDGIQSIGTYHDSILNAELVVSLRPDAIIMTQGQFTDNNSAIATFDNAGIKTVVLDYHSMKLENHVKSNEILGMMLGREEVAKEQIETYRNAITDVYNRISKLPDNAKGKRTYVELGNKGVGEYGNSYSGAMLWGAIVTSLGADNLGKDLPNGYGPLDKEFVLTSNPQVIFIGGSIWSKDTKGDQMRMGFTIDEKTAMERLRAFAQRPEWKQLDAVRDGEVYGVDHGSLRNMADYTFTQSIAKVLYPDVFQDLDPVKEINDFYARYLPELSYTATFMIKLSD